MSQIYYDIEPADRSLIELAAKEICGKRDDLTVHLRPLGRFGKTTASLLTMRVAVPREPATKSYVAKIDTADNIEREHRNADAVTRHFKLVPQFVWHGRRGKRGILVSQNEGDKELKAILAGSFGRKRSSISLQSQHVRRIAKILDIALHGLPKPSSPSTTRETRIRDGFEPYLRGGVGIEYLRIWSCRCGSDLIPHTTNRVTWEELLGRVETFCNRVMRFTYGPIHGDFHPSNIIVDTRNNEKVTVIDFAWASLEGIAAIDYAMIENSLRYMGTPPWLPEVMWAKLDELAPRDLNEAKNRTELARRRSLFLEPFRSEGSLVNWASTVWGFIVPIRSAAYSAELSARELVAARTALLLGQAKFEEYAPPRIAAQLSRLLDAVL